MRRIFRLNIWLTFYFNFKYLPLRQAIKFPVLFWGRVSLYALKGTIKLDKIKTGIIRIGDATVGIFPKKAPITLNINGVLHFKGRATIGSGSAISIAKDSSIILGEAFKITARTALISSGGKNMVIGDNCLFSWDITIMTSDFHTLVDGKTEEVINRPADVQIGNNVWLGAGTTVLKGSVISDGIVLAAKSLVNTRLTKSGAIYGGVPAKLLKEDIKWKI